jgi:hypothetical protein
MQELCLLARRFDHRNRNAGGDSCRNGGQPRTRADVDIRRLHVGHDRQAVDDMRCELFGRLGAGEVEAAIGFENEFAVSRERFDERCFNAGPV